MLKMPQSGVCPMIVAVHGGAGVIADFSHRDVKRALRRYVWKHVRGRATGLYV